MKRFLCRFVQRNTEFRLPELHSLATLAGSTIGYDAPDAKLVSSLEPEDEMPFFHVDLGGGDEAARFIGSRAICVKGFYEVWGEGATLEEAVSSAVSSHPESTVAEAFSGSTFHFKVDSFGKHHTQQEVEAILRRTEPLALWRVATVKLHGPQHCFSIHEEWGKDQKHETGPKRVLLCKKVSSGARKTIANFSLQKRRYIGTTTMRPEFSLLMANQGLCRPGTVCFDPFVGTGSVALACAHFGSLTFGSDISFLTIHGTEPGKSVTANFDQYGLRSRLFDLAVLDQANTPIRPVAIFDSIVCDPPYGVRAGARRVGPRDEPKPPAQEGRRSFPHCVPYGVPDMLRDLLCSAARMLVPGGRLVFWMPSTIEYRESDLPRHPCFRIIGNSLQQITLRWGRRLITMEKIVDFDASVHSSLTPEQLGQLNPTHADFGDFVFHGGEAAGAQDGSSSLDTRMLERLKAKAKLKAERKEKKLKSKNPQDKGDSAPPATPQKQ